MSYVCVCLCVSMCLWVNGLARECVCGSEHVCIYGVDTSLSFPHLPLLLSKLHLAQFLIYFFFGAQVILFVLTVGPQVSIAVLRLSSDQW